jgi:hypothetical protein
VGEACSAWANQRAHWLLTSGGSFSSGILPEDAPPAPGTTEDRPSLHPLNRYNHPARCTSKHTKGDTFYTASLSTGGRPQQSNSKSALDLILNGKATILQASRLARSRLDEISFEAIASWGSTDLISISLPCLPRKTQSLKLRVEIFSERPSETMSLIESPLKAVGRP